MALNQASMMPRDGRDTEILGVTSVDLHALKEKLFLFEFFLIQRHCLLFHKTHAHYDRLITLKDVQV